MDSVIEKYGSINEKYWRNMSESQLENFAKEIFYYYRQKGFPHYPTDTETRDKDFNKLLKYDRSSLIIDGVVKQTMHGLGLAWSYFPHAVTVECGGRMTPYQAFMDDEVFMGVIRKRLKMGTYISDSGIRKMLKIYSGVQSVSNFRPTAAAALYDMFGNRGAVWDMSGGWGGRLLGAIVSNKVREYVATEPSQETFEGLMSIVEDYGSGLYCELLCMGSEDYDPPKEVFELCFTSPPYFDLEKYSDEDTQSYKKFPKREQWIEGFLRPTFENCYYGLRPDGVMAINIADIKGNELEADMVATAYSVGFKLRDKMKLALSNVNLRNKVNKFKYEPIYIFEK